MTKRAKWAFAEKGAAEAFVKEKQSKVATYDGPINDDTKMIKERRRMKTRQKGS
jgi:hypothetical protein